MKIVHQNVAGLDVHKKVVVAAIIVLQEDGTWLKVTRSFGTMTADLLELSDWLMGHNVRDVAMESTGEYWKPVFNILENNFEVIVVNAQHISKVPGRKTCTGPQSLDTKIRVKRENPPRQPETWTARRLLRTRLGSGIPTMSGCAWSCRHPQ